VGNGWRRRGVSVGSVDLSSKVREDCPQDVVVTPCVSTLVQANRASTEDMGRGGGVLGAQEAASDMLEAPSD
jgi:hypothetical protein